MNVVGSLTMLMVEKEHDIAVFLSMGANPSLVKQIFTFELPQNDYSTQADSFFVQRAAEGLMVLSQKSPTASQSFIPMFAYELNAFAAGVTLNRALAVDSQNAPGVFFIINKIATKNEGIITVEFLTREN